MARLPKVGADNGQWGIILNDFLEVSHNSDGTLKTDTVGAPQLKPLSVTNAVIANATITPAKLAQTNVANGVALLDQDGRLPDAQVPDRLQQSSLQSQFVRQSMVKHDLREWTGTTLPNDGTTDCFALFTQVFADLKAWHDQSPSGAIHAVVVPAGVYSFSARLTPPGNGYIGVIGEGMYATIFKTSASNSWLGINQFQVGDPDWSAEQMYFADFTIDGSNQPVGSSYVAGLKGFILHNIRDTVMERVRVYNTHATGFGIDYSSATFIDCLAESCGRARKVHTPDPTQRFGSGSGFGIGFGQKPDETITMIRCEARDNGASGFFGEQLGQPEAMYKSTGLFLTNCISEGNAIGMNDTGTRGSHISGLIARHNTYAGYRVGISNASEQGGIDGEVVGLKAYNNLVGIALEGSADGGYLFNGGEIWGNTRAGVEFRNTVNGWPGVGLRFHGTHIHDNDIGVLGSTTNPIVGLEMLDVTINNNNKEGFISTSPLSRPKITGRFYGNGSWAIALRSTVETESPLINVDVHGSGFGGYVSEHTISDTSRITVTGNPTTVQMPLIRPIPESNLTNWVGQTATLTYQASFTDSTGASFGPHVLATATGGSPRVVSTGVTVTAGEIRVASVDVIAPAGKSIQPAVRYASGGSSVWVAGPIARATGARQRLHFATTVPAGQTVMAVGVIGASGTLPWTSGETMRVTRANLTRGGQLWQYIDGNQTNCSWSGTVGASASTLTIPTSVTVPGFDDNYASFGDGPVSGAWTSSVNSGAALPLVVSSGALTYGSGGTAGRTAWLREGSSANGTLRATVGVTSEFLLSLLVRATDANNYIAIDFQRSSSVHTVRLSKRVATTISEVAFTPSVTLATNDVIEVVLNGTSIDVKVNNTSLFGGPQTITDFTTITKHGVLLFGTAVTKTDSLKTLSFVPA
jgi:hypothetical protein